MSEQIIRDLFQAVDAGDWDSMRPFFCDDVVYERPGYEAIVGIKDLLHFYQNVRMIASGTHQLEHIVVGEECGSCWGRLTGFNKEGITLDERFADVYVFEDGKIKRRRSYFFRPAI